MKTKMCRPVLVETKEYSDLIMCAVDNTLFKTEHYGSIMESPAGKDSYQELILISLDGDEKIGVGEYYLHEYTNYSEIVKNTSTKHYGGKSKIIARQSQLPDKYIQQFIKEYNRGGVIDVLIEMEEIKDYGCADCSDPDTWDVHTGIYKPKLTNGFVTIVEENKQLDWTEIDWWKGNHPKSRYEMLQHCYPDFTGEITVEMIKHIKSVFENYKEPITYTEEEVYKMCKTSFEMYMTNEYSDDELVKVFEDWFNKNKKQ